MCLFGVKAEKVVELVQDLLSDESLNVIVNDIGVITAFRAQTYLVRYLLRQNNLGQVRVGTITCVWQPVLCK